MKKTYFNLVLAIGLVLLPCWLLIFPWQATADTGATPTVANLGQFRPNWNVLEDGTATQLTSLIFIGLIADSSGGQIRMEIELRRLDENQGQFTGQPTASSSLLASGSTAQIPMTDLAPGQYHWQARAVDEQGNTSAWQGYGSTGNADFTIVPIPAPQTETTLYNQNDFNTEYSVGWIQRLYQSLGNGLSGTINGLDLKISCPDGGSFYLTIYQSDTPYSPENGPGTGTAVWGGSEMQCPHNATATTDPTDISVPISLATTGLSPAPANLTYSGLTLNPEKYYYIIFQPYVSFGGVAKRLNIYGSSNGSSWKTSNENAFVSNYSPLVYTADLPGGLQDVYFQLTYAPQLPPFSDVAFDYDQNDNLKISFDWQGPETRIVLLMGFNGQVSESPYVNDSQLHFAPDQSKDVAVLVEDDANGITDYLLTGQHYDFIIKHIWQWDNYHSWQGQETNNGCSIVNNKMVCNPLTRSQIEDTLGRAIKPDDYITLAYSQVSNDFYRFTDTNKYYFGHQAPTPSLPTLTALGQILPDGTTAMSEGATTTESTVTFQGLPTSLAERRASLQIELRRTNENGGRFYNEPMATSTLASSGSIASTTVFGLIPGQYHWQARAIDDTGATSTWQEFGVASNTDFTIIAKTIANTPSAQPSLNNTLDCSSAYYTAASNLVIITHGWRDDANGWVRNMADSIAAQVPPADKTNWNICVFDWHEDASLANVNAPWDAYNNAGIHGRELGDVLALGDWFEHDLNAQASGTDIRAALSTVTWGKIHLIGHSAGANLIQNTAAKIRKLNMPSQPIIHLTFLDAYDPFGDSSLYGFDPNPTHGSSGDKSSWWAEQYLDAKGELVPLYHDTNIALHNAYNFDVTPTNPYIALDLNKSHNWPYEWYQDSISSSSNAYAYGFLFALEHGSSTLPIQFNPGNYCALTTNTISCPIAPKEFTVLDTLYYAVLDKILNLPITLSASGIVNYYLGPRGTVFSEETGSPVWFEIMDTTDQPSNILKFDFQFLSMIGAQGVLTVFVDDNPVYKIDERRTPAGLNTAGEIPIGELQPGPHKIGFRLDPFSDVHSIVQISDVQLGYLEVKHIIDETSPSTTAVVSGTPGKNGWYTSDVQISLNAADTESGVAATYIALDGAATTTATSTLITAEGIHTLTYYSTDNVGNVETPATITIKIDKTAPEAAIRFNPEKKDLLFEGKDNVSPTVEVQDNDDQIILTDEAGNTTVIRLKEKDRRRTEQAEIKSISYDGIPADISKNKFKFTWRLDKQQDLKSLTQEIKSKKDFSVLARYDGKKTTIIGNGPAGKTSASQDGLVLLKVTTNTGDLGWSY